MLQQQPYDSPLPNLLKGSPPVRFLSSLYSLAMKIRNGRFTSGRAAVLSLKSPVISIGGIRAGGTGKTPCAMMVGEMLQETGNTVAILSRGYRRKNRSDFIAAPGEKINWHDCGDEPAMLHNVLSNCWLGISAHRLRVAQQIEQVAGNVVFILDDGFQHRQLKRDLDIVCVNESLFNDRMLPDGFLREQVSSLGRAHVICLIGKKENRELLLHLEDSIKSTYKQASTFIAYPQPCGWINAGTGEIAERPPCSDPVAVCGIARPERFFESLESLGVIPCKKIAFSDHYSFTKNDFVNIHKLYSKELVITEKDAIRINEFSSEISSKIWYLKVRLKFHSGDSTKRFKEKLQNILPKL
ncbi:MAG: tetraacyldisaccharide 4'-kinase [Fibrobacter sp.]|nr:tetraacyldisaccharide 4'-kinase [Fibrobacter sp.]